MKSLASFNGYTEAQIKDQLLAKDGTRTDRVRYRLVDPSTGLEFRDVTSVVAGSCEVSHGALDEIHGAIKFKLYDDPLALDSYAATVLADAPLVYLRLNETSGAVANDSSGNGRHGSYGGVAGTDHSLAKTSLLTADGTDLAVSLLGSINGYVFLADDAAYDTTTFTIEYMIKTSATVGTATAHAYRFDGGLSSFQWTVTQETNGSLSFFLVFSGGGSVFINNANVKINDGKTHHVRITYDGARVKMYIDYAVIAEAAATGTPLPVNSAIVIGQSVNGTIDEFAYYNKALNFGQCRLHYQAAIRDYNQINFGTDQIRPYYGTLMADPPKVNYGEWETANAFEGWTTTNVTSAVVADGKLLRVTKVA